MNRPNQTDIGTYSGGYFDVFNPDKFDVAILDIAHALALTCRWGGHCKEFYSVAQHSVFVSKYFINDKELALQGLLHDAAEAYMGDVPRPIKHNMPAFREQEDKVLAVIWEKYGLQLPMDERIHEVDNMMLNWEACNLLEEHHWATNPLPDEAIRCWTPEQAERMFLHEFEELTNVSINRRRHSAV